MNTNKANSQEPTSTIEKVINNGFCIGCGVCSAQNNKISVNENKYGEKVANISLLSSTEKELSDKVCPISNPCNENEIALETFGNTAKNDKFGHYLNTYAGYSNTNRLTGSSGGILTHILIRLFETGKIDYAIAVRPQSTTNDRELEFAFDVISNPTELKQCGTSFYYPVSYDQVLEKIKNTPGRYAITGVPCFHKAIRLLKKSNPVFDERIKYQLGLVCGQMKSTLYLEYLLRKTKVKGPVTTACFRKKNIDDKADRYLFEATSKNNGKRHQINNRAIGSNWGMGFFKPKVCDYCDDIYAETADVAVMDAWLPQYVQDGKGTSLVVTRSTEIDNLLTTSINKQEVTLTKIPEQEIIESQLGGIRHRHDGLSYRLTLTKGWQPSTRITPSTAHSKLTKIEQHLRIFLRDFSKKLLHLQLKIGSGLLLFNLGMFFPVFIHKKIQRAKRKRNKKNRQ